MSFRRFVVWRNGDAATISAEQLRMTDFVLTPTGQYLPAPEIMRLTERTCSQASGSDLQESLGMAVLIFGAAWLLAEYLEPARSRPKRVRSRNQEPVASWKKDYVAERDGWRCTYCQCRVTTVTRHIDHSVSRRNGGSNHLNNLRTACRACNLEKGSLNARQFRVTKALKAS